MLLGRPLVALLCSALAAASALKHVASDEVQPDSVEFSYGSPTGQVPLGDNRQEKVYTWPHHPPKKDETKTIYQVLNEDEKFSRLVKVINISQEVVSLLNNSETAVTFFAVPNRGLKPPKHKGHHKHSLLSALSSADPLVLPDAAGSFGLSELLAEIEDIEHSFDDEEDKERRWHFIKAIIRAVLEYHILPQATDLGILLKNNTHATNLTIPDRALDEEALRIRVGVKLIPPSVNVNFFSTIVTPNVVAKNGLIHVIDHPILPPPSIFQTLFLVPKAFGTLTSALQRVGLTNAVEWRYVPDEDKKWQPEGSTSSTIFVPSNSAFEKLPWKLRLFLFSPFGERVLKKLLQFHVVPGVVFHSDYLHNATVGEPINRSGWTVDPHGQGFELSDEEWHLAEEIFAGESHFSHEKDKKNREGRKGGKARKERKASSLLAADDHPRGSPSRPRRQDRCRVREIRGPHRGGAPLSKIEYAANFTLPTLVADHALEVRVVKFKNRLPIPGHSVDIFATKITVNKQTVWVTDVPARNGALHLVGSVLSPHPRHGHHLEGLAEGGYDSWVDWEEWLVDWAEAN